MRIAQAAQVFTCAAWCAFEDFYLRTCVNGERERERRGLKEILINVFDSQKTKL